MKKNPYSGKFIIFEGLDGSGQSTQTKLLGDFLTKKGQLVVLTKEPTLDSQPGRKIRDVLDEKIKIDSAELQKLFAKDRKSHLDSLIIPALKQQKLVISDRYFFSSFAFGALDLDLEWLIELNKDFILPDLTFFLDVSPEICLNRIKERNKGFEFFEKKEKLARVYQNYQLLLKKFKDTYPIKGELSKEEVFEQIKEIVISQLEL
jgi:dTMP kinase